ncbi:MAG TPA: hypothetical protein VFK59_11315 [Actinomycetota bacterium]|nr:hypothetical protein [Actinomycetota bacterium]
MRRVAALLAAAMFVACGTATPADQGTGPTDLVPVCDVSIEPTGWQALPAFRERYADHVGVRLGFRDGLGRELYAFAGIPGEFGEGMPAAGEVELAPGLVGRLSGSGVVWVVEWEEGGPCDPRVALGNGFEREEFLDVVEEAGIAAGPG